MMTKASTKPSGELMQLMLDYGGDIDHQDYVRYYGRSPLMLAGK